MSWYNQKQKGMHLLELIFAVGIFALMIHTYARMVYLSNSTIQEGIMEQQALLQSAQALEITRTIRDRDFSDISVGIHGFVASGSDWNLSGSSYQKGPFNTRIRISNPSPKRYNVFAETVWDMKTGTKQVFLETVLTEWNIEKNQPIPSP